MLKLVTPTLFLGLALAATTATAQNIQKEDFKFKFTQLPTDPVDKSITNFQGNVVTDAEEKILAEQAAANAANEEAMKIYEQELKVWEGQCEQAREQYATEMENWNSKSLVWQKLNKENKPRLRLPYKPQPKVKHVETSGPSYDKALLRDTYLSLEGFNQDPDNAINYTVKIYDWAETHQIKRKEMVKKVNGESQKYYVYVYEVQYKLPVGLKVLSPSGSSMYNKIVPGTDHMTKWESKSYNSKSDLTKNVNISMTIEAKRELAIKTNFTKANDLCNDMYGFPIKERTIKLYSAKSKKMDFTDFEDAATYAKEGLGNILGEEDLSGIEEAYKIWAAAIDEHDLNPKKGRLKKKNLLMGTFFMMAEARVWQNRFDDALSVLTKIEGYKPSAGDKKHAKEMTEWIETMKQRHQANN